MAVNVNMNGADASTQIKYILENPLEMPVIAWKTLAEFSWIYWRQFIGVLGYGAVWLPGWFAVCASIALAAAYLGGCSLDRAPRPWLYLGIVVLSVSAVFGSLYLN